jgi:hypothetical protein
VDDYRGFEVAMSGPEKFHLQTQHSLELDMIHNLTHPTACNLVIKVGGNYRIKVRKRLVYPHQAMLDDVHINNGTYAVVKVDMVYVNAKNMKLEVPPDNTTLTLQDAINRRVMWMSSIDVDPSVAASASTTTSQPHTAPGLIFPETQPDQMKLCPSPA